MSVVKVYYDLMSLPCRALYIVLELTQTPYEKVVLSLGKGGYSYTLIEYHLYLSLHTSRKVSISQKPSEGLIASRKCHALTIMVFKCKRVSLLLGK